MKDIYPLTVISDRYGGTYSGGNYTAWNEDHYNVPDNIAGDDMTCFDFWENVPSRFRAIGKGDTPEAAIVDLRSQLEG